MTQTTAAQTKTSGHPMSRNEVLFSGNLGKDPEISYTSGGKALTKFSIAVYQGKGKDDMWMNITCSKAA